MSIINYFTKKYSSKNHYLKKKAEYSVTLILIILIAMIVIFILEYSIVGLTTSKLIISSCFLLAFIFILFILKKGYYELATNILLIGGILRSIMIFPSSSSTQLYVMAALSMITISVIYIKLYQIMYSVSFYYILCIIKIPNLYNLVQSGTVHESAYTQSLYSLILLIAVGVMLRFLTGIINREIREAEILINYANTDPLTGLNNRRKLESLYYEVNSKPVTTIIMDIDYFKKINDKYGHSTGDLVLIDLAKLITKQFNDCFISRWGGEEFLIMSHSLNTDQVIKKLDDFYKVIRNHTFLSEINITVSAGITTSKKFDDLADIVRVADQGLYFSKENGRDKYTYV